METNAILGILLMITGLVFAILSALNSTFKVSKMKQQIPLGFLVNDKSFWFWLVIAIIGFIIWRFL